MCLGMKISQLIPGGAFGDHHILQKRPRSFQIFLTPGPDLGL